MTKYYYLGTYLPSLSFDMPLEIKWNELETLLRDNLTEKDYQKVDLIRGLYDLLNLRAYWLKEELDPFGNLDPNELEEALLNNQAELPVYVSDFLEKYNTKEERLHHFPFLLSTFFKQAAESSKGFLRDYLSFERELRLVMTGFRAKRLGRDLSIELQYENPEEELIAQILAQKDAKEYEPPEKYQELKGIFKTYADDPLGLQRAIDEYRFNFINQLVNLSDQFSIESILAYTTQFMILQKWFQLDKQKGNEIVDIIVKEV